jgi:hypothetical protein
MSHSNNLTGPTESWVEESGTMNPAPSALTGPRDKDARDSAAGCRERAAADLSRALDMDTSNGRQVFEKSAASWTKRADMLHRIETGIEARLHGAAPSTQADDIELTDAEIAEDAADLRL